MDKDTAKNINQVVERSALPMRTKDKNAVTELIKTFASVEKKGWSIRESNITSRMPDINQ